MWPHLSPAGPGRRGEAFGRLVAGGLTLLAAACRGWPALSPASPTAAAPPSLTAAVTLTAAEQAGAEAPAPNVGLIDGTAVVLDLPEVTPLPDYAATGELHWPLPVTGVLKQTYWPGHPGIDVAAPPDTPVLAADSGAVVFADEADVYGNLIIVDHGNGYQTWYGHLSGFAVAELEGVQQGQTIGYVGSTGASTGPHLHLEVRREGRAVPPFSHLQDAPQSILEANAGFERRTATAVAAATQTRAAFIAGQTATARREAELTQAAAQQTQAAAEQTRLAASRTATKAPATTPTRTYTPTLTLTLTLTLTPTQSPTAAPTTETLPPEPSATVAATPSQTPMPPAATATSSPTAETPSATPGSETPTGTPSATPGG